MSCNCLSTPAAFDIDEIPRTFFSPPLSCSKTASPLKHLQPVEGLYSAAALVRNNRRVWGKHDAVDSVLSQGSCSLHYVALQRRYVCKTSGRVCVCVRTHAVCDTVCVCVQRGVIIYNTLRLNEAISHNAYSLTRWAGLGWAAVMSAQPLQIYSEC